MLDLGKHARNRPVEAQENRRDVNESESSDQEANQRFAIVGEVESKDTCGKTYILVGFGAIALSAIVAAALF